MDSWSSGPVRPPCFGNPAVVARRCPRSQGSCSTTALARRPLLQRGLAGSVSCGHNKQGSAASLRTSVGLVDCGELVFGCLPTNLGQIEEFADYVLLV